MASMPTTFSDLPTEITSKIFLDIHKLVDYDSGAGVHRLVLVSKSWHVIAIQTPGLWSRLNLGSSFAFLLSNPTAASEVTERFHNRVGQSGALTLEVCFTAYHPFHLHQFATLLQPYFDRVKALRIFEPYVMTELGFIEALATLLGPPLPQLEALELDVEMYVAQFSEAIVLVQAPVLKVLRSGHVNVALAGEQPPPIEHLDISWCSSRTNGEDMLQTIRCTQNSLRSLTVREDFEFQPVMPRPLPLEENITLPFVKRAKLDRNWSHILRRLRMPALEYLEMDMVVSTITAAPTMILDPPQHPLPSLTSLKVYGHYDDGDNEWLGAVALILHLAPNLGRLCLHHDEEVEPLRGILLEKGSDDEIRYCPALTELAIDELWMSELEQIVACRPNLRRIAVAYLMDMMRDTSLEGAEQEAWMARMDKLLERVDLIQGRDLENTL